MNPGAAHPLVSEHRRGDAVGGTRGGITASLLGAASPVREEDFQVEDLPNLKGNMQTGRTRGVKATDENITASPAELWGPDGNAAFSSERSLIYTSSSCAATVELVWRQTSIATLAFSSLITLEGNICLFLLLTALLHSAVCCSAGLSCAPAAAFFPLLC